MEKTTDQMFDRLLELMEAIAASHPDNPPAPDWPPLNSGGVPICAPPNRARLLIKPV